LGYISIAESVDVALTTFT